MIPSTVVVAVEAEAAAIAVAETAAGDIWKVTFLVGTGDGGTWVHHIFQAWRDRSSEEVVCRQRDRRGDKSYPLRGRSGWQG